jgi:hypothetical protein
VYVEESLSPSFVATSPGQSVAVFIGPNGRGPTTPTLVRSWTEYVARFGGFDNPIPNNYLPYSVYNFFNNGGRMAYIVRAVGTGAVAASVTLDDRQGVPADTLKLDALSPGTWGNGIYIEITNGSAATLFNVTVYLGGSTAGKVVERWADVSMDPSSSQYAPARINSISSGSAYLVATDMAPTSVIAYSQRIPAAQAPTALTAGADGAAPTTPQTKTAMDQLDVVQDPLLINLPGNQASIPDAITYAEGRTDCFVIVDPASGLTSAALITFNGTLPATSFASTYGPWINTSDPSSSAPGATRLVPPGGFVLGKIADTDASRGVFKAPAGLQTRLLSAVGVERMFTNAELDALNVAKVNVIKQVPGAGIVIYGARTLSNILNTRYINVRRTLISVATTAKALTQFAAFEPNDSFLWDSITAVLGQYLLSFWQSGGLRGNSPNEAFFVKCDEDNNTQTTIDAGVVNIEIGVATQKPAEFIVIKIGQWEGGRTTVESV